MTLLNNLSPYGLVYALGFLVLFLTLYFYNKNDLLDALLIATYCSISTIIGARSFYVLFYEFSYYKTNPLEIIEFYKGGMSFFGGLCFLTLFVFVFFKNTAKKILDALAITAIICLPFGRYCNYLNQEVFGRVTDVPWAVIFLGVDLEPRHPSQLYEAVAEGPIVLLLILITYKIYKKKFDGKIACLFIIFYSILRFFIEFTREVDSSIGFIVLNLSLGQIFCFISFIFGIFLYKKFSKVISREIYN